ncbi:MAG: dipeptidase [Alphaproteobacteria bacterium]
MQKIIPILLTLSLSACATAPAKTVLDVDALHAGLTTIDTHVDIPLTYMTEIDPGTATDLQVDLGKLTAGGLDAAFFIVYTPQGKLTAEGYTTASKIAETRISAIQALNKKYYNQVELAKTASDVRRIIASGKHAVLVGMENAYPLGESLDEVPSWAERGVRYMGITHFGHNQFGDSSNANPERDNGPRHNGLSELGRSLVLAMNEAGIMVDVSHAGKETMMQAADLSRAPIIASHSGVKAIADSARNLDDEQLRKIRDVNGVAQIVALDAYVKPYTAEQDAFQEDLKKEMGLDTPEARSMMSSAAQADYETRLKGMWKIEPRASVADFVDHIDHAVKVAGIDHVGIASDFDGGGGIDGWEDASETKNVTAELVARGYSRADIAKIWGGNLLRVMEAAEKGKAP